MHCRSLTIRLLRVISRTLFGGGSYLSTEMQSVYFTGPVDLAMYMRVGTDVSIWVCMRNSLERKAGGICLHVNADKTEFMCFNQRVDISTLKSSPSKLVDKLTYLGSSVSLTENDINTQLAKAWTAINRLSVISKSDLTDKIKRSFLPAAVESILLYWCTTWTPTKCMEKKLDGNYTRILRAVLNKAWR